MNIDFIREVGLVKWICRTIIRQTYKRILRKGYHMTLPSGVPFFLPVNSKFATEAYVTGADVDWGSEKLLYDLLSNKGAFLDIGANIGYYSLYMLPKVTQVYAFEPDPRMVEMLKINIGNKNISIIEEAVAEKEGIANFTLEHSGEVSHFTTDKEVDKDVIEVKVITVDSFVQRQKLFVEAIKIDVEGFDLAVIEGSVNTLLTQRPYVLTEAQPDDALFEIARKVNYKIFGFVRDIKTRKVEFKELFTELPPSISIKMTFMIPYEVKI